jgi:hypothetical protein
MSSRTEFLEHGRHRPFWPDHTTIAAILSRLSPSTLNFALPPPGSLPVLDVVPRLRCSVCGPKSVRTVPDWREVQWVRTGPLTGRLAGPLLAIRFKSKLHERTLKVLTRLCKGDDDPYGGLKGHLRRRTE